MFQIIFPRMLPVLTLGIFAASIMAQEIAIPDSSLDAAVRATLQKPTGPLTQQDLLSLTNLSAISRGITNLQGLGAARNLTTLLLDDNRLTNSSFSDELTNLTNLAVLDLSENRFTALALPDALTNLTNLRIEDGQLRQLTLPAGLTQLSGLRLGFNQLTNLTLPDGMTNLSILSLFNNRLTDLSLSSNLRNLSEIDLDGNQLSSLLLPAGLTKLTTLIVGANQLTRFTVPADMTNLVFLRLNDNQLTNLTLPPALEHLSLLHLPGNHLHNLSLSAGLTNLATLNVTGNQLTNLTLPPDVSRLSALFTEGNPLTAVVLSEPLAATAPASVVDPLRNQGIGVFTYPVTPRLVRLLPLEGAFKFGIVGPPGVYSVLSSTNLMSWSVFATVANPLGGINFVDVTTNSVPRRFYRLLLQGPPTNMVFIPPNTFTMGSPSNDFDHSVDEVPQTAVTLTRGFWIGKYEVTQREYLDVVGENPSDFPGDLSRPVSGVSWQDATNYCAKLTQRQLAAGRISPGSKYRLPTEAEWECAARAETSTRFSYGDDLNYTSLTNYAWFLDLGHPDLIVHSVGQKLPNRWGLYDTAGNVWEWCQDWYGPLPGGAQTDPTGPAINPDGAKVARGGAYDYPNSSSRSASRLFRFLLWPDSDVGFRVVLATEP
jgi:formylglycine-generating enzyme required for sulfatase activity